jgi:hypothetical protein
MERTAMQNHIDWIKTTLEVSKDEAPILVNCLELCLKNAESKLEEEKNQIIYTYKSGFLSGIYKICKNILQIIRNKVFNVFFSANCLYNIQILDWESLARILLDQILGHFSIDRKCQ